MQTNTEPETAKDQSTLEVIDPSEAVNLDQMARAESPAVWNEYETKLVSLRQSADTVLTLDPANPANSKLARQARLSLRSVRIEIEAKRKELTDFHLRRKQSIDAEARVLKEAIEEYETKLKAIEDHAERVEAERIQALTQERTAALAAVEGNFTGLNLGAMEEPAFAEMLKGATLVFEQKQKEAREAEEARIAKEKAEAEERERIRKENARLRAEAEARERAEAEIARQKQAEADRIAAEERKKAEAAAAPDKEKVKALAASVRAIQMPEFATAKYRNLAAKIRAAIEELANKIESTGK